MPQAVIKESLTTQANIGAEWIDIIGQTAPTSEIPLLLIISVTSLLVAAGFILYKWSRQPQHHARIQLRLLQNSLQHNSKNHTGKTYNRVTALKVARLLNLATGTMALKCDNTLLARKLHRQLNYSCFSPDSSTKGDTLDLINTARSWLKQYTQQGHEHTHRGHA